MPSPTSLRRPVLAFVFIALFAFPAGADVPDPQVTDACGDATSRVEAGEQVVVVEQNNAALDVKSGAITGRYGRDGGMRGFTAAITVCGAVSAEEGGYGIGWDYHDGCFGEVLWTLSARQEGSPTGMHGSAHLSDDRKAVVREVCYGPPDGPLDSGRDVKYAVDLPAEAVTFAGDTVSFDVDRSVLPEAGQARLASGAVWESVGAVAMAQDVSAWGTYRNSMGPRGDVYARTDFAWGGEHFVVGR